MGGDHQELQTARMSRLGERVRTQGGKPEKKRVSETSLALWTAPTSGSHLHEAEIRRRIPTRTDRQDTPFSSNGDVSVSNKGE